MWGRRKKEDLPIGRTIPSARRHVEILAKQNWKITKIKRNLVLLDWLRKDTKKLAEIVAKSHRITLRYRRKKEDLPIGRTIPSAHRHVEKTCKKNEKLTRNLVQLYWRRKAINFLAEIVAKSHSNNVGYRRKKEDLPIGRTVPSANRNIEKLSEKN